MAKTNRRPVDRLERLQRIEHRRHQREDEEGFISPRDWDLEDVEDETLDQYETSTSKLSPLV